MSVIELARLPRMVAGPDARARLAELAGGGARVLLVADPGLKASGRIDEIEAVMRPDAFRPGSATNSTLAPPPASSARRARASGPATMRGRRASSITDIVSP